MKALWDIKSTDDPKMVIARDAFIKWIIENYSKSWVVEMLKDHPEAIADLCPKLLRKLLKQRREQRRQSKDSRPHEKL